MFGIKKRNQAIDNIENLFNTIDKASLVFKDGVKNYLYNSSEEFNQNLSAIASLEADTSILRREIENNLYTQTALVRSRGDIMRLLERMENIVDIMSNVLSQFEIETPYIPSELNNDFMKLTDLSTLSIETAIPAARAYFRIPDTITDKIHRVYFYEKETDKHSKAIKRHVFHNMDNLKLSEKFHLRYFALHIENLSRAAAKVADQLSVMSIKRSL